MTLADQIIEHGPYRGGDSLPIEVQTADDDELNALRDELIELRRLKTATEAQQRFLLDVNSWDDHAKVLCLTCRTSWGLSDGDTLAELNRRAGEHGEGCR